MKRLLLLQLTALILTFTLYGQRGKTVMMQPLSYHQNIKGKQTDFDQAFQHLTDKPWIVYSLDTALNTLIHPDGTATSYMPRFMEKFYVLDQKGAYLQLIKDEGLTVEGNMSKSLKTYGWMHYEKLLLGSRSLSNDAGRPLLAIAAEKTGKNIVHTSNMIYQLPTTKNIYHNSSLTITSAHELEAGQIYYVYKVTNKAALIGLYDRINPASDTTGILGWSSVQNLVFVENRLAIEPNWEANAAYERKTKQIYTSLFFDPFSAYRATYISKPEDGHVIWNADPLEDRWTGKNYRFPVVAISGNIIRAGLFYSAEESIPKPSAGHYLPRYEIIEKLVGIRDFNPDSYVINETIQSNAIGLKYFEGFTIAYHQSLKTPLYKFVYLLNRMEIMQVLDYYKGLRLAVLGNTLYGFLQGSHHNGWTHPSIPIDSLTIDELLQIQSGLPLQTSYFGNLKVSDLIIDTLDYNQFNIQKLLKKLDPVVRQLEFIHKANDPDFSFSSNNIMYYWIELDNFL